MKVLAYLNPLSLARSLHHHRDLIGQLAWRSFTSRYKGSLLGFAWYLITPLVSLAVYTFAFGYLFRSRWSRSGSGGKLEFAITVFCGLVPFTFLSDLLSRAPTFIVSSPNYVKKVVFPLEVICPAEMLAGLGHAAIGFVILILSAAVLLGQFHWTLLLAPLGMLPLVMLALGLGWMLSAMGVFVRDVGPTVTLALNLLMFLTPVFYDQNADWIPARVRHLLLLNPLATILDTIRRAVLWNQLPRWPHLLIVLAGSAAVMMIGYAGFMKSRKAFSDVI